MIRVVVVDDQALIRQGFGMILSAQPDIEVVGEAADGQAALAEIARTAPDVVLMDVRMPGMDGIEATRRIRAESTQGTRSTQGTEGTGVAPGPRVLILTTFGLDDYVTEALFAGASGFLLKDSTPEELIRAVRVVASGEALLSPAVTSRLIARVLPSLGARELGAREPVSEHRRAVMAQLTEREREVLLLVAKGQSNAEIGASLYISEPTVKTHVSHLLAKLGLRDRVQAVIAAYELGLLTAGS